MPRGYRGDGTALSAWLPSDLASRFRELTAVEGVSPSMVLRRMVQEYIDRHDADNAS